jgi:tetratricopeptide (TPR) repeat protein
MPRAMREIGVGLAAWICGGCGADPPEPPVLEDPGRVDPVVAARVERALAEVRRHPRSAALRGQLGMLYDANAIPDLAATCYEQALTLDDREPKWWYHAARSRHDLGDLEGALTAIDGAIDRAPSFAPLRWRQGLWLLSMDRHQEAEASFRRAAEIAPGDEAGWLGLARVLLHTNRPEEAASILNGLLKQDPEHGYARQLLGRAYLQAGDAERAKTELARGAGSDPDWSDSWELELLAYRAGYRAAINTAQRAVEAGEPELAIQALAPLRATHPTDVTVLTWLSTAHLAANQPDSALEVLHVAERHHPDHFVVHLQLGDALARRGDLPRAIAHVSRAIELNPGSGPAYVQKARLLRQVRDAEGARDALEAAIRRDAGDLSAWIMLGEVQYGLKRFDEMAETMERAAARFPHVPAPLAGLAIARGELGQFDEAREALARASRLNPDDPDAAKAKARVDRLERGAAAAAAGHAGP